MCGIAGVLRLDGPATAADQQVVWRMLDLEATRGPDGAQVHAEGPAVLGHRRLSIIDLSAAAAQPMANEDATVWVTYNGEIYNFAALRAELVGLGHRFRSRTDSEVLVHGYEAWGLDGLVGRLRGMFAFGLYDARRQRLGLARDRLGIKPLYYTDAPGAPALAFASEVKALVRSGAAAAELDRQALAAFLCLGSVPAPRTIAAGVRCLPPGHVLEVDREGQRLRRYWDLPAPDADDPALDVDTAARRVRPRLLEAVEGHLVSDVPLGVFLSGGVDSGGLVALARERAANPLHTLTVTFAEPGFSEAVPARGVAVAHGTVHQEVPVGAADFLDELPAFFEAMDQPTHDGVNTFFIARAARKAGLTVVLSGAGGDEVFRGYPHHRRLAQGLLPWIASRPGWLRAPVVRGAAAVGRLRGREQWGRLAYLAPAASPAALYLAVRGFFAPDQVARLSGLAPADLEPVLAEALGSPADGRDAVEAVHRLEVRRYLHDQLLRDADVFGMAHSIEIRVPYLDHEVVETVARLPARLKLHPGENKPLLARAVGDPTVRALAGQPKRGFSFPLDTWLRTHADTLAPLAERADGLERREVRRLWRAFRAGRLHWSRAWALVVLGAKEGA